MKVFLCESIHPAALELLKTRAEVIELIAEALKAAIPDVD